MNPLNSLSSLRVYICLFIHLSLSLSLSLSCLRRAAATETVASANATRGTRAMLANEVSSLCAKIRFEYLISNAAVELKMTHTVARFRDDGDVTSSQNSNAALYLSNSCRTTLVYPLVQHNDSSHIVIPHKQRRTEPCHVHCIRRGLSQYQHKASIILTRHEPPPELTPFPPPPTDDLRYPSSNYIAPLTKSNASSHLPCSASTSTRPAKL